MNSEFLYPKIINITQPYDRSLLRFRGINSTLVGKLYKAEGFKDFNYLIDINRVFSSNPGHHPIDRTDTVKMPWKFEIRRPWKIPKESCTLDQALEHRVNEILKTHNKIKLFWSGGIDSTTMVNAFLKFNWDHSKITLVYTQNSVDEHPEYPDFLKKFHHLGHIRITGKNWDDVLNDGLVISGDSGDETIASLDRSFFETYGIDSLYRPWQDFFYEHIPDEKFLAWAHDYFSLSGREISTVLEARWFFYAAAKLYSIMFGKMSVAMLNGRGWHTEKFIGFYDYDLYESWIYHNLDLIISGKEYKTYKQVLKDWCFEFDGCDHWAKYKEKTDSGDLFKDITQRRNIQNRYSVMLLSDGTFLGTKNLPWLSRIEWQEQYQGQYDYLNNDAD